MQTSYRTDNHVLVDLDEGRQDADDPNGDGVRVCGGGRLKDGSSKLSHACAHKLLTENSALKLVTAVVMLPRPWGISRGQRGQNAAAW